MDKICGLKLLLLYRLYLFRILVQYETILLGLKDLLL